MHLHEDASFVFVIRGVYISSAMNAGALCPWPALVSIPPEHATAIGFSGWMGRFSGFRWQMTP